jgi:hypothetical protein
MSRWDSEGAADASEKQMLLSANWLTAVKDQNMRRDQAVLQALKVPYIKDRNSSYKSIFRRHMANVYLKSVSGEEYSAR